MYLNTVFKYNVFKYCPALIISATYLLSFFGLNSHFDCSAFLGRIAVFFFINSVFSYNFNDVSFFTSLIP